jgi:superoxide dismutase, Cu-Zn family
MDAMRRVLIGSLTGLAVAGGALALATTAGANNDKGLKAKLVDATGARVGTARIAFEGDGSRVKVEVQLPPSMAGFHGFHVHSVGQCVAPFTSAGGHLGDNPADTTHRHRNHEGDLPVLLVNSDGHAWARFDTDRLDLAQLKDANGSAFIIHAAPDNYANIPATDAAGNPRYSNPNAVPVYPNTTTDAATLATGDAGGRIACGVIG